MARGREYLFKFVWLAKVTPPVEPEVLTNESWETEWGDMTSQM